MAPTAWRRMQQRAGDSGMVSNLDQDSSDAARQHERAVVTGEAMPVQCVDLPPVTVVYVRHLGPYGPPILDFWEQTVCPWLRNAGWLGRVRYGIAHDDPDVTQPARCRYDAAVEVPDGASAMPPANLACLPGGRYAVLPFWGRNAEIGNAWRSLLRDWLPSSGMQLSTRPCFERYRVDVPFDETTGAFACDLCVPVAPLWEAA